STALRDTPCGETFHHATQVDRIENVGGADLLDHVAARFMLDEQAFLGQYRQRLSDWRARHAELLGQWRFSDTLTRAELALQDHFTDTHQGPGLLSVHVRQQG